MLAVHCQPRKDGGTPTVGLQCPRGLLQAPLETKVQGHPSPLASPWDPRIRKANCTVCAGFCFCFLFTAVVSFLSYVRSLLTAKSMLIQRSCTSQSGEGARGGGHQGQAQGKIREAVAGVGGTSPKGTQTEQVLLSGCGKDWTALARSRYTMQGFRAAPRTCAPENGDRREDHTGHRADASSPSSVNPKSSEISSSKCRPVCICLTTIFTFGSLSGGRESSGI